MNERLSPSPSLSSGSHDENMNEPEPSIAYDPTWKNQDAIGSSSSNNNKRRAQAAPAIVQPFSKARNKRGDDNNRFTSSSRGGQDSRKEEMVDSDLARSLKKAIGDPFDESILHLSS